MYLRSFVAVPGIYQCFSFKVHTSARDFIVYSAVSATSSFLSLPLQTAQQFLYLPLIVILKANKSINSHQGLRCLLRLLRRTHRLRPRSQLPRPHGLQGSLHPPLRIRHPSRPRRRQRRRSQIQIRTPRPHQSLLRPPKETPRQGTHRLLRLHRQSLPGTSWNPIRSIRHHTS